MITNITANFVMSKDTKKRSSKASMEPELEVSTVSIVRARPSRSVAPSLNLFTGESSKVAYSSSTSASSSLGAELQGQFLKDIADNYLKYYAKGLGHTAKAKRYDLNHFLEFLSLPGGDILTVKVSDWTLQSTKDFVEYRLKLGDAPSTASRRLATIKHFGRTLAERVHDFINPAREAKAPSFQSERPKGLSVNEVEVLKNVISNLRSENSSSFLKSRDIFLLELLLATGLRADEVRTLVMGQVDDEKKWLKNVKTKGKKFRNVYLDSEIRERLNQYLEIRDVEIEKKHPTFSAQVSKKSEIDKYPILISFYNNSIFKPESFALSPKTIWRIIANFGKKAQALSKEEISNFHPHKLRHTFAHGLLDSSKDVRLVAQALGHSDVRTTMRYTERGDEELAKAIEDKLSSSN